MSRSSEVRVPAGFQEFTEDYGFHAYIGKPRTKGGVSNSLMFAACVYDSIFLNEITCAFKKAISLIQSWGYQHKKKRKQNDNYKAGVASTEAHKNKRT